MLFIKKYGKLINFDIQYKIQNMLTIFIVKITTIIRDTKVIIGF
jgi:hypothetical protein